MALSDSLISYWSLDEASGNAMDAHGSNDLKDNNTVGTATGKVGNARDFNGTNEYFSIADNASLRTGDIDFTFQGWVYLNSVAASCVIASKWDASNWKEWRLFFNHSTNRFSFEVTSTGFFGAMVTVAADTFGAPSTGAWYLLHAWHDAANNLIGIAVNAGTADTVSTSAGVYPGSAGADFSLARAKGSSDLLNGNIDECGFWKRVLTSSERTELYNSGSGRDYAYITGGGGGAASRLTKYAQNIPHMHGNNRFIRIGR